MHIFTSRCLPTKTKGTGIFAGDLQTPQQAQPPPSSCSIEKVCLSPNFPTTEAACAEAEGKFEVELEEDAASGSALRKYMYTNKQENVSKSFWSLRISIISLAFLSSLSSPLSFSFPLFHLHHLERDEAIAAQL